MSALLAIAAIGLGGAGLVALGFPERAGTRAGRALHGSLILIFGLGAWSAGYAAALLVFGNRTSVLTAKDAVLAAGGGSLLWLRHRRGIDTVTEEERVPRWLIAMFAAAAALCTGAMIEHTLHWPDGGYDAWMIWNMRARFLLRAADFRAAFSPHLLYWLHQDYPWLLPGVVVQGAALRHGELALVAEVASYLFGVLAVAVLSLSLARLRGPCCALLGGLTLLSTPCFSVFVANQQSDVPLAGYTVAAAALLALALEDRRRPPTLFALAGFAAGLGAWTKNEGLLYAACWTAALLFGLRDLKAVLWFVAGFLPLGALLAGFKLGFAPPNDLVAFSTAGGLLRRALDVHRLGEFLVLSLRRVVFFQNFALWILAELFALWLLLRARHRPGPVGLALLLAFAAYVPIYLLQPHPLGWIFRTSVDRIFIQLWPASILATLSALLPARTTAHT